MLNSCCEPANRGSGGMSLGEASSLQKLGAGSTELTYGLAKQGVGWRGGELSPGVQH